MSLIGTVIATAMMFMQGIDDTGTAVARPYGDVKLDEATGSYFQVFEFYGRPPFSWQHAARMVRGYIYEGREGELATVKDIATHYFLLLNFPKLRTSPMWIGLSATCGDTVEYNWIDGAKLTDQTFRGFAEGTQRDISRACDRSRQPNTVIPIYYQPDQFGVRWQMADARKELTYMMVEFSKPAEDVAAPAENPEGAAKQ